MLCLIRKSDSSIEIFSKDDDLKYNEILLEVKIDVSEEFWEELKKKTNSLIRSGKKIKPTKLVANLVKEKK